MAYTDVTGSATPPPLFLGEHELYDMIMQTVEPDLVSAVTPTLPEKYKDETPDDRRVRAKRYEAAFAAYDRRFAEYQQYWNGQMRTFEHASRTAAELRAKAQEEAELSTLEQTILAQ